MEEALITCLSVVSSVVGLVGLYFYRVGLENMFVSSKLSCGTSGTILLYRMH
jgi:diphthamide biosynthesis methyltransferase